MRRFVLRRLLELVPTALIIMAASFALVRLAPRTGRTHQIRVHLAAIGCPVLCDALYSGRTLLEPSVLGLPPGPPLLGRQALHAACLALDHPASGERTTFAAPLPADMEAILAALRQAG